MSLTRRLAAIGAPVLLASALTGCGLGGPPTDASAEDYCAAQTGFLEYIVSESAGGQPPPASEAYDELQDSVSEQEDTGTPEDMPDDARTAWEDQLESASDLDEDEFTEAYESGDPGELEEELSDDEEEGATSLSDYTSETCGNPLEDLAPQ